MKNLTFFFIAFLLINGRLTAQTNPEVIAPAFDDSYSKTIKLLEAGETDINYRAFRESFIESKQFLAASQQYKIFDSLKKEMYKQMGKSDYPAIIKATKGMLSIDYTSMIAHKILQQTYKIMGDSLNWKKYHDIEFGLLRSIVKNGDGKTCETAWPVIQIEEEYFILDMLDATFKKQSIDNSGGLCDKMEVKEGRKKKTYYFEVSKVFEGYKKLEKTD
ncbi:MAG: hypothetical protein JWO09_3512 [Bacteroidetes bacterium]|nr:hypothetical protein [Bacteroidota bacterium]